MLGAARILPEITSHFPIFELINFPSRMIYSKENVEGMSQVNIYFLGPLSEENSQWKIRMLRPFSVWLFFWWRRWRIPSSVKIFSAPYKQSVRNLIKHSQKYVWYIKENSGFNNSNSMHMLMYEGSPINRRQCGFVFLHLFRGFN